MFYNDYNPIVGDRSNKDGKPENVIKNTKNVRNDTTIDSHKRDGNTDDR